MKKLMMIPLLVILGSAAAWAGAAFNAFKMMSAGELSSLLKSKDAKVAVYDVNTEETRKKDGVIPGAKLLASSSKYDVKKELPSDKGSKLVFYCANTRCTASHKAAERAVEAGYTDVNVMSDGIQGWAKAGNSVTHSAQ